MTRILLLAGLLPALLYSQDTKPLSPLDSTVLQIDTNRISVVYSRPSIRGRKIMGGLVPYGSVWRTGANAATLLRTSFDMTLGSVPVPRGRYSLWTIPGEQRWTIIVNKQTGQWGTRYDPAQDLARFEVASSRTDAPVEVFTMALRPSGQAGGALVLAWENAHVEVPFSRNDRIRPISPLDSVGANIGGTAVKVRYSRPYARGRLIWGVVVPWDSLWRLGANAATVLEVSRPVHIGESALPAGIYTLYAVPAPSGATLIVSRKAPGPAQYDQALDAARIPMESSITGESVDPFTIRIDTAAGTSRLVFAWMDRRYSVPITSAK